jgi:hypothetical protein
VSAGSTSRSLPLRATCVSSVGATEAAGRFTDPAFDPRQRACCCARVVETPTPRWTVDDAVESNVKKGSKVEMIHQKRAASSPIWYDPSWRGHAQKEPI